MKNDNIFLDSTSNIIYSNLKGLDQKELILQIMPFYIPYRQSLDLPNTATFGIEIEYEDLPRIMTEEYLNVKFPNWLSKIDNSLTNGGEINSPILNDERKYWLELKQICTFLKNKNANTNKNAGGHVHVSAQILGEDYDAWRKFIKIYTIYENILFRFAYGEKIGPRGKIYTHAIPLAEILNAKMWRFNRSKSIIELSQEYPHETKRIALNLNHVSFQNMDRVIGNTIEFRFPNATIEENIWQNNINTFVKMVLAAKYGNIDEKYLDQLLKKEEYLYYSFANAKEKYNYYNRIWLQQALEFVDLIFTNNLDKTNFLRQYVKGFEENIENKGAILSRKFQNKPIK